MKRILVVDDSATVRDQVRTALQGGNYQILEAEDGAEGLRELERDPGIALVLCDVNMPRLGGLDLLDSLVRLRGSGTPPFVLLTSEADPRSIERARKAGARAWIVKPFKPALLLATVRKMIGD